MKNIIIVAGVLIVILLSFLFYKKYQEENKDTITLAVAQQPAFALVFIADKEGFFADEGLSVSYKKFSVGRDALQAVIDSQADLATVYDIPVVRKIYEGQELGILTTLHNSTKNTAIVALQKTNIKKPSDLRGKRIAVSKGTSTEFYLYTYLLGEEINQSDVTIVNIEPEQTQKALLDGTVDAAVLFNPYLYNFQKSAGKNNFSVLYSGTYKEMSLLVGKKEYIKQHNMKVIKVLKALQKASEFAKSHKPKAASDVSGWIPGYNLQAVNDTWNVFLFSLDLNNTLLISLTREAQFFHDMGIYKGEVPKIRDYFMPEYLKKVHHEGVTFY